MNAKRPGILGSKKKPGRVLKGVQPSTISKVAAQVEAAESAETQEYEIRQISLANIRLWETQPRTFKLTLEDVYRGSVAQDDEHTEDKSRELEELSGLAMSLKEFGMLNAPLAYALPGKSVMLLAGQRRTMASIFALIHIQSTTGEGETTQHNVEINEAPDLASLESERIAVKVFSRKPDELVIEQIGVTDNVQRAELPIPDKLRWVLKFADLKEGRGGRVGWRDLIETLGLSRSQAFQWLNIVKYRTDVWVQKVIAMVLQGRAPLRKLTDIAAVGEEEREALYKSWFNESPTSDSKQRISLGATNNLSALRSLVLSNLKPEARESFEQVNWEKPKEAKKAFGEFLKHWEEMHEQ
jgi:hypothetical protein